MAPHITRRRILSSLGLLAGASLLAACGGAVGVSGTTGSVTASLAATTAAPPTTAAAATSTTAAVSSTTAAASSASTSSTAVAAASTTASTAAGTTVAATSKVASASGAGLTLQYLGQGAAVEQKIYNTLADNFHKANPGISINVTFSAKGGAAGILEQMITLVAGGSGPDVYWTHVYIGADLYKKGIPLVLDPFLAQDQAIKLDDYYAASYLDYTFDGKHTALPRELATDIMFYRTDLFDKAGISYPDSKWTWDDLRTKTKQLTNLQGTPPIFGYGGPVTSQLMYTSMALENGSDIVDRQNLKSLYPNAPVVEAIQYMADFRYKDHSAPTAAELTANKDAGSFALGQSAIAFSGYYLIATVNDKKPSWNYDVSNMPVNAGGKRFTSSATSAHSAWSGTKHAQEAWQWVKYLSGTEASTLFGEAGLVIPPLKAVAESLFGKTFSVDPHHRKVFTDDFADAHGFPIVANWTDILNAISEMLAPVWTGKQTAKEAIAAGNAKVDALLKLNA
ncbi:MAG: ABC transporter substrate-binding protein [Chloroflexota bacterium]